MEPIIGLDFGNFNSFPCYIQDFNPGTRMGGIVHDLLPRKAVDGIPSVYFYSKRLGRALCGEEAVTGKAIVTSMMRLATEMSSWNKAYATEGKVAKRIEELGLTPHQAQMLGFLYSNPELDTVSALSARLHVSKGSLSLMLSKLEVGGFVQKKAAKDGDDGRKIYISLTAKGESAVQEMVELLAETAAVVFDCMDAHRRMQIYTKVQELLELFNTGGWKE